MNQTSHTFDESKMLEEIRILQRKVDETNASMSVLNQTIYANMKHNVEMMKSINSYIDDQMEYRSYRQKLEENSISLQLTQKELEIEFLKKKYDALSTEKQENDAEAQNMMIESEKLRLEVEALKRNLDSLQEAEHLTNKKSSIMMGAQNSSKILNDIMMTAVRTVTAIAIGGAIAFILWTIRFYIESTP